ncbi:hypothetical protein SKAU_G00382060 [Synaphobranchus kaupii]|uniref:Uncharacterized protein n=1 Tax=Synaphobranchus kaupii TaxID=118154 RepID=A0A9Q1EDX6_SYNKA|nr:hypothetical protein SKAU_G00382060 [Synaphobranchus kaupii]
MAVITHSRSTYCNTGGKIEEVYSQESHTLYLTSLKQAAAVSATPPSDVSHTCASVYYTTVWRSVAPQDARGGGPLNRELRRVFIGSSPPRNKTLRRGVGQSHKSGSGHLLIFYDRKPRFPKSHCFKPCLTRQRKHRTYC